MPERLLTIDNLIKLFSGVIAVVGLYYAIDKRLALMEQKVDYYIALNESKEHEARTELAELKVSDKEINRQVTELKERLLKIAAILPKTIKIEDDND